MKGNEKILICHLQLITTTRICASRFKCATLLFPFAFNKNIPHLFDSLRSGFYLLLWKHFSYVKAKSATSSFWLSLRVFIWYMVNVCRVLYEREWEREGETCYGDRCKAVICYEYIWRCYHCHRRKLLQRSTWIYLIWFLILNLPSLWVLVTTF